MKNNKTQLITGKNGPSLFCPMLDWIRSNDNILIFSEMPALTVQISPLIGKSQEWKNCQNWRIGNLGGWKKGKNTFTFILREKKGVGENIVYNTLGFFTSMKSVFAFIEGKR